MAYRSHNWIVHEIVDLRKIKGMKDTDTNRFEVQASCGGRLRYEKKRNGKRRKTDKGQFFEENDGSRISSSWYPLRDIFRASLKLQCYAKSKGISLNEKLNWLHSLTEDPPDYVLKDLKIPKEKYKRWDTHRSIHNRYVCIVLKIFPTRKTLHRFAKDSDPLQAMIDTPDTAKKYKKTYKKGFLVEEEQENPKQVRENPKQAKKSKKLARHRVLYEESSDESSGEAEFEVPAPTPPSTVPACTLSSSPLPPLPTPDPPALHPPPPLPIPSAIPSTSSPPQSPPLPVLPLLAPPRLIYPPVGVDINLWIDQQLDSHSLCGSTSSRFTTKSGKRMGSKKRRRIKEMDSASYASTVETIESQDPIPLRKTKTGNRMGSKRRKQERTRLDNIHDKKQPLPDPPSSNSVHLSKKKRNKKQRHRVKKNATKE